MENPAIRARRFFFGLAIFSASFAAAQEDAPELITDRPDQTESSSVAPKGALQIESGFLAQSLEADLIEQQQWIFNTTLLRYGLLDNFELRLGLDYYDHETRYTTPLPYPTYSYRGLGQLYAGFKVKIADEEGWRPEVAYLGGLSLPFTVKENYRPDYPSADFRFAFSHTLNERLSLGYNLGAEWGGADSPMYFYSVALGAGLTEKLGAFIESFGWISTEDSGALKSSDWFDAGLTYLLLPNFQLDLSGGIALESYFEYFVSAGLTFRIPE